SIARELRRTWRVEYLTAARPGDQLRFTASAGKLGSDTVETKVPDSFGADEGKPSPLLPSPIYGKAGDLLFTALAGLLVLGAWMLVGCSFLLAVLAALSGRSTLVILVMFLLGAFVPYFVVWFKAHRRMQAFEDQLPDLLITMAASLKAGHSFKQGIQSVVDEGQEPAAKELRRVLTDTQLGRPMEEALQETAERIGSKNFSFVITAVNIQRQVGGSLAGLFDMVADTLRQRQQFARKIRSLTAMGRASAYVLVGLPFFIALAITA